MRQNGEVSPDACGGPVGNVGEERHPVVVVIGSRFREKRGDRGELVDVEVGPDGGRTWLSTRRRPQ
jgi:hypothetical protein